MRQWEFLLARFAVTAVPPAGLKVALDRWLAHDNFAADGAQVGTLESFRRGA